MAIKAETVCQLALSGVVIDLSLALVSLTCQPACFTQSLAQDSELGRVLRLEGGRGWRGMGRFPAECGHNSPF